MFQVCLNMQDYENKQTTTKLCSFLLFQLWSHLLGKSQDSKPGSELAMASAKKVTTDYQLKSLVFTV